MSDVISTIQPLVEQQSLAFVQGPLMGKALAVTEQELSYFRTARYILRSHDTLTEKEITTGASMIASIFASTTGVDIDDIDDQFGLFMVYADRKGLGKFALTYNEELDEIIRSKMNLLLQQILFGPKEMFIEIYDNDYLTEEDKSSLLRVLSREMVGAVKFLESIRSRSSDLDFPDDICNYQAIETNISRERGTANLTTISSKCYDEVCLEDSQMVNTDKVWATVAKYESPPTTVQTVDTPSSYSTPMIYCFELLDLLNAITEDPPINPQSQEPFSPMSLALIKRRFSKEIAMYRRYKDNN